MTIARKAFAVGAAAAVAAGTAIAAPAAHAGKQRVRAIFARALGHSDQRRVRVRRFPMRFGKGVAAIMAVIVLGTLGVAGSASASTAGAGGSSAPTPAVPRAGAMPGTPWLSGSRVVPEDVGACTGILQAHNPPYVITPLRYGFCQGAGQHSNTVASFLTAVAVCTGGLVTTAVALPTAGAACTAGAVPGATLLTAFEFCYNNGGYACLNAWGGGPFVNAYTGGPEARDSHQDFVPLQNQETGTFQLAYIGAGSSGECIGDSNNNSTLADTGLVSCGTAPHNEGWGTDMQMDSQSCPSGEVAFFDNHWKGYLGPPNGWVDGSHFFLNKPSSTPICFGVGFD